MYVIQVEKRRKCFNLLVLFIISICFVSVLNAQKNNQRQWGRGRVNKRGNSSVEFDRTRVLCQNVHLDYHKILSLSWSADSKYLVMEIIAATKGYFMLGFTNDATTTLGADFLIAWVDSVGVHLEDRHSSGIDQALLDVSQDLELLSGWENATHTVIRFRRALNTCDPQDYKITNSTVRVLYAYSSQDPSSSDFLPLAYHSADFRDHKSLLLVGRPKKIQKTQDLRLWELRNNNVSIPNGEESLFWCKIFSLPRLEKRSHVVGWEPVFSHGGQQHSVHHMRIYECHGDHQAFDAIAKTPGAKCYEPDNQPLFFNCNSVVAAWTTGSEGFYFPLEAGYPLDPVNGPLHFMLETHFDKPSTNRYSLDGTGIRMIYTPILRPHDAGLLSLGMDVTWKHLIPPGQKRVLSQAHCIADCTEKGLPPPGVNVFAVMGHTHLLGREVRLRHIRGNKELSPILVDDAYDVGYQEFHELKSPARILPGDHLISECVYNSESRSTLTIGGLSTRHEMCLLYALYWPRTHLSICYSSGDLSTALRSMGVDQYRGAGNDIVIEAPVELAGMTLEDRLKTVNWMESFEDFQRISIQGPFNPLCWAHGSPNEMIFADEPS
ncbi:hypothetical protein QYM36_012494 [Artemia franciscana]|uniref:DOMON domain-containing protein n=1 Tax=Artemia franciscana TaxID=6661 RepID=A0AA88L3H4_ARTSF|nr:hypothetical protein QYM36_012494 [Artemia franciscana]